MEKLFQMGRMMEMEQVQLCGIKAVTIKKASMHDYGMDFYYSSLIVEMLRSYYEQDGMLLEAGKKYEDRDLETICFFASLTDAPAYVIQAVSEVYDADFRELWERVKDAEKRKRILYQLEIPQETISVSTMDFFGITPDDMILFWDNNENVSFSQELKT